MTTISTGLTIIGGGLTGLTLAYLLKDMADKIHIIEARNRPGGRIYTHQKDQLAPIEMGATWLGSKHQHLNNLLERLELGVFEQRMGSNAIYEPLSTAPPQLVTLPKEAEPSYRIQGGSSRLIHALIRHIPSEQIHYSQSVQSIEEKDNILQVKTSDHTFNSGIVVATLPPYLLHKSIKISPSLPQEITQVMSSTHTWMGASIKVGLRYAMPFWREESTSGTIFSNVGPISEFYDHADVEDQHYALKGFISSDYFSLTKLQRLDLILNQLRKYYGTVVNNYTDYEELVWQKEAFTFAPYAQHILPHQNNGHAAYQHAYLNGKLFIAGSETATKFPGYMDGAVESAHHIYKQISSAV